MGKGFNSPRVIRTSAGAAMPKLTRFDATRLMVIVMLSPRTMVSPAFLLKINTVRSCCFRFQKGGSSPVGGEQKTRAATSQVSDDVNLVAALVHGTTLIALPVPTG